MIVTVYLAGCLIIIGSVAFSASVLKKVAFNV